MLDILFELKIAHRNSPRRNLLQVLLEHRLHKQMEDNEGTALVSEGIDSNYFDMLNYAIFALILIDVK